MRVFSLFLDMCNCVFGFFRIGFWCMEQSKHYVCLVFQMCSTPFICLYFAHAVRAQTHTHTHLYVSTATAHTHESMSKNDLIQSRVTPPPATSSIVATWNVHSNGKLFAKIKFLPFGKFWKMFGVQTLSVQCTHLYMLGAWNYRMVWAKMPKPTKNFVKMDGIFNQCKGTARTINAHMHTRHMANASNQNFIPNVCVLRFSQ